MKKAPLLLILFASCTMQKHVYIRPGHLNSDKVFVPDGNWREDTIPHTCDTTFYKKCVGYKMPKEWQ